MHTAIVHTACFVRRIYCSLWTPTAPPSAVGKPDNTRTFTLPAGATAVAFAGHW